MMLHTSERLCGSSTCSVTGTEQQGALAGLEHEYAHDVLNPLMLCHELERLYQDVGVQIFEHSAITDFCSDAREARGQGFSVKANTFIFAPSLTSERQQAEVHRARDGVVARAPKHPADLQPAGHVLTRADSEGDD
jgi:hypothetical protein